MQITLRIWVPDGYHRYANGLAWGPIADGGPVRPENDPLRILYVVPNKLEVCAILNGAPVCRPPTHISRRKFSHVVRSCFLL